MIYRVTIQCNLLILNTLLKHEFETALKVNKEDVLSILGRYEDKSSEAGLRHLVYMDVTHSFQVLVLFIYGILLVVVLLHCL